MSVMLGRRRSGASLCGCVDVVWAPVVTEGVPAVAASRFQYSEPYFSMADLLSEIKKSLELHILPMPGAVLRDAVRESHSQGNHGGFIQCVGARACRRLRRSHGTGTHPCALPRANRVRHGAGWIAASPSARVVW